MKKLPFICALLGCTLIVAAGFGAPAFAAYIDSGEIPSGWAVWDCWYWPYNDEPYLNPNLYDYNEAMYRYDLYDSGANSRGWEYQNHGPPQGQPDWAGHCHAWSGAACWEYQPTTTCTLNGIPFRVRDRKGLLCEMYFGCADGTHNELYEGQPSPGLFWRYLRQEIKGIDSMHGHAMGFIGELYYGAEVWNYPVYKYSVSYNYDVWDQIYGTMTIYVASDSSPAYADSTTLHGATFIYQFSGVEVASGEPIDSGYWSGSSHDSRPDAIWRPFFADTWTKYVENYHLDESHLAMILNPDPAKKHIEGVLQLLLLN